MKMNKRLLVMVSAVWALNCAYPLAGFAQCPCDADIAGQSPDGVCPGPPDGSVTFDDITAVVNCAGGLYDEQTCPDTFALCDVNCDGVVDFVDVSVVLSAFQNIPDPCGVPTGACCTDNPDFPGCFVATEYACTFMAGGTYGGDGTDCNPSLCDCNNNGIPDEDDIAGGTSDDCNTNGIPDECEFGACCIKSNTCEGGQNDGNPCSSADDCRGTTCTGPEVDNCALDKKQICEDPPVNGTFLGPCKRCPKQNSAIIKEGDGSIVIHFIGPPTGCPTGGGLAGRGVCTGPPYTDAWVTSAGGVMCHDFGSASTQPIPADFFGPGSDPFDGVVCLEGVPLGVTEFGDADTLIERSDDPFDRCVSPSTAESTVSIEIVALSLVSVAPITVTFNGGQNPEDWDVAVDLSPSGLLPGTPASSLTATKTHFAGGEYTSVLHVQPRFTFTRSGSADQILDTFDAGIDAIPLVQNTPRPWVIDVDPNLGASVDLCSDFHAGIENTAMVPEFDCNANGVPDECDIANGTSTDDNQNFVPDDCEQAPVPTVSEWGLVVMSLLVLAVGTMLLRRRRLVRA